jgi:hypothetical protein
MLVREPIVRGHEEVTCRACVTAGNQLPNSCDQRVASCVLRIRSWLRSARRGDHSEALTLLNWPDAFVRIAGPGPACYIQADSDAKIRRRCHLIVTSNRTSTRKMVELRGFEPLTFCMPYKSLLFRNVAGCGPASRFNRRTSPGMA